MDTETDSARAEWSPESGQPTLVEVFPQSRAIPLPPKRATLGRTWLAEHGIEDAKASSDHARLTLGSGLVVEDLDSKNGTWVNGRRVQRRKLVDGDLLRAGRTLFVYRPDFLGARKADAPLFDHQAFGVLISPFGFRSVRRALDRFETTCPRSVLIIGETGVGKENVARAVAERLRAKRAYVAVNAAAIPKDLFESEIFGHEAGSFSGATRARMGRFVEANGGTFFLDEIATLSSEHQPKLLRAMQGFVQPIGGREIAINVLMLAATNEDVAEAVETKEFRRDLHARFEVRVDVPSLADRPEDLFAIAKHLCPQLDVGKVDIEAAERMALDAWPENVRGLRRFLAMPLIADALPALPKEPVMTVLGALPREELTDAEIDGALAAARGNQSQAARDLGVAREVLLRRLKKRRG